MNIAMLLDLPATVAPEQVAIRDGDREVTYTALLAGAGRAAQLLDRLGVQRGDRVGMFAVNSVPYVEILFGTLARGAVPVLMNYRAKETEARHLIEDSGVTVLFTDTRYQALVSRVRPPGLREPILVDGGYAQLTAELAPELEIDYDVDDGALGILIYTSGTTALPKGVKLTNGGLVNFALERGDVTDGSERGRSLVSVPLYHVAGLSTLFVSLYAGRSVILMAQFDAGQWLELAARHRATHAFLVPTMLRQLLASPRFAAADLPALAEIAYGAAPMPLPVIKRAIVRLPDANFSGAYGMSETTSTVTVLGAEDHRRRERESDTAFDARLGSVGTPVPGVELEIRDGDAMLPRGEAGEVLVRTGRAMDGYWGAGPPAAGAAPDTDGWMRTGDRGFIDDEGRLHLTGRENDTIIRGGENIAPQEVENALLSHPEVVEAAVVGLPDEEWGERVAAVVAVKPGTQVGLDDLRDATSSLSSFKRPELVTVVDELPRTSTGKLLRRELVSLFDLPARAS